MAIADAMNGLGGVGLWDDKDGFYYDQLRCDHRAVPMKVRSMVGIIPLFACELIREDITERMPGFTKRMRWFMKHRSDLARHISWLEEDPDTHDHYLLAIPSRERLMRVLRYVLDENEFLSPYGIRGAVEVSPRASVPNGDRR